MVRGFLRIVPGALIARLASAKVGPFAPASPPRPIISNGAGRLSSASLLRSAPSIALADERLYVATRRETTPVKSMDPIAVVVSGLLIAPGAWIIFLNSSFVYSALRKKKSSSWIPLLGGAL